MASHEGNIATKTLCFSGSTSSTHLYCGFTYRICVVNPIMATRQQVSWMTAGCTVASGGDMTRPVSFFQDLLRNLEKKKSLSIIQQTAMNHFCTQWILRGTECIALPFLAMNDYEKYNKYLLMFLIHLSKCLPRQTLSVYCFTSLCVGKRDATDMWARRSDMETETYRETQKRAGQR